jgi:triosephosphate isomerase
VSNVKETRKKLIAGNWKMNKKPSEAAALINGFKGVADGGCYVAACVPFTALAAAADAALGSGVLIGAQNLHFLDSGAYTGEISADMLLDLGVKYVVIGHSERRQYFAETDETVNLKTAKALEKGLIPIVCVGERLEEREGGITGELIKKQIKTAFSGISAADAAKTVIAYEPVWAIGTGKVATDEQAEEICELIRNYLETLYNKSVSDAILILYGGSMNAQNAAGLLAMPNIDGGLIGGASLKADDFTVIINAAKA